MNYYTIIIIVGTYNILFYAHCRTRYFNFGNSTVEFAGYRLDYHIYLMYYMIIFYIKIISICDHVCPFEYRLCYTLHWIRILYGYGIVLVSLV